MPDEMPIFRVGAAALMTDEALAPLAEPPAIARIDVLGARLPETGSCLTDWRCRALAGEADQALLLCGKTQDEAARIGSTVRAKLIQSWEKVDV